MKELKNVKISKELHMALKIQAARENLTISVCLERCLVTWAASWKASTEYMDTLNLEPKAPERPRPRQKGISKSGS